MVKGDEETFEINNGSTPLLYIAKVDKFTSQEFIEERLRRILRHEKLKSRVVKCLGRRYWQPISESIVKERIHEVFINHSGEAHT